MKISKLLPITLALSLCMTTCAFAATEETKQKAQADYQLQLAEFLDIEATAPAAVGTVSFANNYTAITIDGSVAGSFQVISNTNTKDVYLYATCLAESEVPALYGDYGALKLVFTNTAAGGDGTKTTDDVVKGIRDGSYTTAPESPNAIAFALTVTPSLDADKSLIGGSITGSKHDTENIVYTIPNGVATFACSVSGSAQDDSFSARDTNGIYRATLYMSDTPYTATP